jgi:hypothetical protein
MLSRGKLRARLHKAKKIDRRNTAGLAAVIPNFI